MYGNSLLLWYSILPLIASSSNLSIYSTSDGKKNYSSTVQNELSANTTKNYEHEEHLAWHNEHENFTESNRDVDYGINSANNNSEDDNVIRDKSRVYDEESHKNDSQTFLESRKKLKEIDDTNNSMSAEISKTLLRIESKEDFVSDDFLTTLNTVSDKNDINPYKICDNITCIRLCCPLNNRLINGKCIPTNLNVVSMDNLILYINDSLQIEPKRADAPLLLIVHDPCPNRLKHLMNFTVDPFLLSLFLENGSLNITYYMVKVESTSYCLAVNENEIGIYICPDTWEKIKDRLKIIYVMDPIPFNMETFSIGTGYLLIILFSLLMFVVYCVVPEFRNVHGVILRIYSALIFIPYVIEFIKRPFDPETIGPTVCIASALIRYYCFLANYCWLNVMSFNMWRIFRPFCVTIRNAREEEGEKLIMFSAYGWGVPFIFIIIIIIVEFVPGIPSVIQPGFTSTYFCWFKDNKTHWMYYYGFSTTFLLISIVLSILTGRNIANLEKDISHQLKDAESRRYNDNKDWSVNVILSNGYYLCTSIDNNF